MSDEQDGFHFNYPYRENNDSQAAINFRKTADHHFFQRLLLHSCFVRIPSLWHIEAIFFKHFLNLIETKTDGIRLPAERRLFSYRRTEDAPLLRREPPFDGLLYVNARKGESSFVDGRAALRIIPRPSRYRNRRP